MKNITVLYFFILFLYSSLVFSTSAIRYDHESYTQAALRNTPNNFIKNEIGIKPIIKEDAKDDPSAYRSRALFKELDLTKIPSFKSLKELNQAFKSIRNKKYLSDPEKARTTRRISWFFPDDGCWVRAELIKNLLKGKYNKTFLKIFIFGDLNVRTKFHPQGKVNWWYHVAPIMRVGDDIFVFDPSIDYKKPMKLKNWVLTQSKDIDKAEFSLCHGDTFTPHTGCLTSATTPRSKIKKKYQSFSQVREKKIKRTKTSSNILPRPPSSLEIASSLVKDTTRNMRNSNKLLPMFSCTYQVIHYSR